jgi:phage protein D
MPSNNALNSVEIKVNGQKVAAAVLDDLYEVIVDTALSLPGSFSLSVANDDPQHDQDFQIGKDIEISYTPAFASDEAVPVIKGIITAIEPVFTADSSQLLRVRGYEKSIKLTQGTKTRTFCDMKDSDIIQKIAGDAGLTVSVGSTSVQYEHVIQFNQTDWDFIQSRARNLGFLIWMDGDTLKIDKPPSGSAAVTLAWPGDLKRFEPRETFLGQVAKANAKGWDPKQKTVITSQVTSGNSSPYRSIGETATGASSVTSNVSGSVASNVHNLSLVSTDHAQAVAQAGMDRAEASFVTAEGECRGNPDLAAGKKVKITGVSPKFAGEYLVTQVRHEYSNSDYTTYFSLNGAEPETILSLLAGDGGPRENRIDGVVTAVVTNLKDPDNANKVKVNYPWLVDTLGTPVESGWARVAVIGGGKDRGVGFIPEVDDEVLVAFADGDINAPYVVAALWNGTDTALTGLVNADKGTVVQRVVRSRTGHIIILDDTDGSENITIKDKSTNNSIVINSSDNTMTIKSKGNLTLQSEGDVTIQGKGKLIMKSDQDASLESSTGKATVTAGTELALTGSTKASVTGGSVSKVELQPSGAKLSGAMAEVSGTGTASVKGTGMVEIQGALVKIN